MVLSLKQFRSADRPADVLTEKHLDEPLDFDSVKKFDAIVGSGGMVVMDDQYLYGRSCPFLHELYPERILW